MNRDYIKRDMRRKAEDWIYNISESNELSDYFYEHFTINTPIGKRYRVVIEIEED